MTTKVIDTFYFRAMGCQMMAAVDTQDARHQHRLTGVQDWFEAWEQVLSRFRDDSELSQLNRAAGAAWQASPTLWQVFQAALAAEEFSDGLVNPLVLDALLAAGYTRSFMEIVQKASGGAAPGTPVTLEELLYAQPVPSLSNIQYDADAHSLHLPPGAGLDFGGVAKGWAAQQAMRRLRIYGPALVDAGGDIAISGLQRNGEAWHIGIDDPFDPECSLGMLAVGRCGIATSGRDYRRWQFAGRQQHHLIDPRTGEPANTDLISVTVLASDVMLAETAAKTILILGSQAGSEWLQQRPSLTALLTLENGDQLASPNFSSYLVD